MLCHNWALIESGEGGAVEIYFFQDTAYTERPKVVDSLHFNSVSSAIAALKRNGFAELSQYPGPWVGAEPQGDIWDGRASGPRVYSEGGASSFVGAGQQRLGRRGRCRKLCDGQGREVARER